MFSSLVYSYWAVEGIDRHLAFRRATFSAAQVKLVEITAIMPLEMLPASESLPFLVYGHKIL